MDVWHLLRLDKLQKKINAKAAAIEDYKKNKESIERAKIAKEVVSGVETAGAVGGVAASSEGTAAAAEGGEEAAATSKKAAKKAAKKAKKQAEDEAPKATTLFAEMNQKRSYETSQKQAAMQRAYQNGQGFGPMGAPMQQRPQGAPMQQRPQGAPMQQRPQGAPMQQRPQAAPMQQRPQGAPMHQRPGAAPQGGNSWVNRVNPGDGYMNRGNGGNPGGPGGMPGGNPANQTKTWTRK